jgi:histidine triad (HIT) family protein
VAFVDLMPRTEGHTLVVPREPAITLLDLSADAAVACMRTIKLVAPAVKQAVNAPGLMVMQINGVDAGQTVPHVHFHIIPRRAGEPLLLHAAIVANRDRLHQVAERIRANLAAKVY